MRFGLLGAAVGLAGGCLEPTQVTLELSTDALCVDATETRIAVGQLGLIQADVPSAVTSSCERRVNGRSPIGDLVVVPGPAKDKPVGVEVVLGVGQPTEACQPPSYSGGCIVARRALGFLPHTPILLPIELNVSCLDIPCGATQTCKDGSCVDAFIPDPLHCTEPGGCEGGLGGAGTGGTETGGSASATGGAVGGSSGGTTGAGGTLADGGAPAGGETGIGGGLASGGSPTGGASAGGTVSGGAGGLATGGQGTGGGAAAACGDGTVDSNESCDDNNVTDNDGCSSDCREEFLLAVDSPGEKVILLDRVTGDFVRDFAVAPDVSPYEPLYAMQMPTREVLVTDQTNGNVVRYDAWGNFVDKPITGRAGISQLAPTSSDVLLCDSPLTIEALSPVDLSYIEDAAWPDDCNAVQVLDDRWLLSTGINIGEVQLFDRVYLGASAILYDAVGVYDMHYTTDGRLLLADYDAGSVLELTQTTVPTPPEVLGIPLAVGRSVTVATPFSVFELPNGDWLIGSDAGLFVYDPASGSQLSQKRATAIRTIELYIGPLPGE